MTKKSKKYKTQKTSTLKASEIEGYILQKYEMRDFNFWKWFFNKCPVGSINTLVLDSEKSIVPFENMQYYFVIKNEFIFDADDEKCLKIENDLSSYDC